MVSGHHFFCRMVVSVLAARPMCSGNLEMGVSVVSFSTLSHNQRELEMNSQLIFHARKAPIGWAMC